MCNDSRLAELRLDNNLQQKDVAKALKIKEDTYSKWERKINDIPIAKINEIANFYKVNLNYLLELSNKITETERTSINLNIMCERLLALRKEKNLTQEKLSNDLGFPQRTYSHYENGSSIPTTYKLYYIAQYFDVSFDFLVGRSDVKEIK